MKIKTTRLALFTGLFLTLLTMGSFLGQFHWLLDILSHFNRQYAMGLALCLTLILLLNHRRHYALTLLPALFTNIYLLVPYFLPPKPTVVTQPPLRVATLNIFTGNDDYHKVIDYLEQTRPDVVLLTEAEPPLMVALDEGLGQMYPYVYDDSRHGTVGLALLSRYPLAQAEAIYLEGSGHRPRRFIRAALDWQGRTVTIYGAHPLPPLNGRWAARRNEELKAIRARVAQESGPVILLGDLNASPWSYPMRHLLDTTDLRHAAFGFDIRPTWYLGRLLGAPLDHILVSSGWTVSEYETGGEIGSDHHPVLADLVLDIQ